MAMQGVVETRVRNVKTLLRYTGLAGRRIVEERIGDELRVIEWNAGNDYMASVEDAALVQVLLSEGDFFIVASIQPAVEEAA
ncbi:MAG: hypothetical protein AB7R40_22170 [Nitrospiraceae bacterium]